MSPHDDTPTHDPPRPERPRYRVPVGLPVRDEGRRAGAVVSVVIHALIIGLLIVPFFLPSSVIRQMQSGGGAGPAGGGGGGTLGTGGEQTRESLRFVKLVRTPVPTPTSIPAVPPPVTPKVTTPPVVPPPKAQPPAAPQKPVTGPLAPASGAATPGAGGGTGADGTAGTGPGSGGGVGSGVGVGNGSANGPGTGGGPRPNHDPQPVALFLPPIPAPESARGLQCVAEFDVDSTGRVLNVKFTPTPDGDYNRRLASVLRATRFRPGTRPDGTPIRASYQMTWVL